MVLDKNFSQFVNGNENEMAEVTTHLKKEGVKVKHIWESAPVLKTALKYIEQ